MNVKFPRNLKLPMRDKKKISRLVSNKGKIKKEYYVMLNIISPDNYEIYADKLIKALN